MEKIIICDNFLTEEEMNKASEILKSKCWKFDNKNKEEHSTPFWKMDLSKEEYFNKDIKKAIENHFAKEFKITDIYANGQTFGQDSIFHNENEDENNYVFCLYFTKIKKAYIDYAGGYIYFKFPDLKYKVCFEPLFNRGIFFPSSYLRKSSAFSRFFMDMRISVVWKLKEITE
jgi:hypothetical protein